MKKYVFLFLTAIALCLSVASCSNNPKALIQAETTAANLQCPQDIGNGLTMTKVEYTGLYIVYYFKGSDGMYFSQDNVTAEVKNQIVQTLRLQAENDASIKNLLSALKKAGVGMIYHYYVSDSFMDIVIDANEL